MGRACRRQRDSRPSSLAFAALPPSMPILTEDLNPDGAIAGLPLLEPRTIARDAHTISRKDISPNALRVLYRLREGGSLLCFVRDPDGYRIELIDRSGK